jgi:NAD(P)H-flavin reductase
MKPRHAAALALVGWYLMVPPPQSFKNGEYREAPLVQWTHRATFDTEVECNHETSKGCHHFQNGSTIGLEGPLCWAKCIASDDPRLKEK